MSRGRAHAGQPGAVTGRWYGATAAMLLVSVVGCGSEESAVRHSPPAAGDGSDTRNTSAQAPRGPGVYGQVVDPSGAPIEMATITVLPHPTGSAPLTQQANVTDANGRYFFPTRPGEWAVTVTAFRREPATAPVAVTAGDPTRQDFVLPTR